MQFVDSHAHIYLPEFDADRNEVLMRATEKGVAQILMPAIDSTTHQQMLEVETTWPYCRAMMGLHPCSVNSGYQQELALVEKFLKTRKFIAVGEIGLDFYWDTTFSKEQYEAFERQIGYALLYDLPIVIHSRNAIDECIDVVRRFPGLRGVFHCFSGTVEQARQIMNLQFYLGIGGVVTYKKAGLDAVVQAIGLEALLLETDAPYLPPVPYRGKRNECSYVPLIAAKVAEASGMSVDEVAAITTQNTKKLFGLL